MAGFTSLFKALTAPVKIPIFVVTLDALGTLYHFREPVSAQYFNVAQKCGLRAKINPTELDQFFKSSFKHYNTVYPNYGKGKLEDPQIWWSKVVKRAFREIVPDGELPPNLDISLYRHFSTQAAYQLYLDVLPFLHTIEAIKDRFVAADGPLLVTGIVTNSDPRARDVLTDLGLEIGPSRVPEMNPLQEMPNIWKNVQADNIKDIRATPYAGYYSRRNHFDFLCTSYDAESEKPSLDIWLAAKRLVMPMPPSRMENSLGPPSDLKDVSQIMTEALRYRPGKIKWVHIGDEFSKDYLGAVNCGLKALHLAREKESSLVVEEGIETVSNLEEAAMVVSVMAQDYFNHDPE
ncbi:uncharacterized protein Z518_02129 [Rhinocladiella mackenziei CBS 650.93]|uniref:Haloacid dehalogenase-like hydrolase n=1 Tax=Rhinocladiella mackenziei CBS 650.93 TaxID=1442369 RepID=A0A0D2IW50_9EURO|nr:uncharacterized protein Z518_02129 [Rhinocladiella mackenziei CBS 650.93]KIX07476.1 hypothetical protein Z518_02129 [Rhinocladiella mackenziei CBS 650.93]